jgi:hypothetical protein
VDLHAGVGGGDIRSQRLGVLRDGARRHVFRHVLSNARAQRGAHYCCGQRFRPQRLGAERRCFDTAPIDQPPRGLRLLGSLFRWAAGANGWQRTLRLGRTDRMTALRLGLRPLGLRLGLLGRLALGLTEKLFDFAAERFFERGLVACRHVRLRRGRAAELLRRLGWPRAGGGFAILFLEIADEVRHAVEYDENDRHQSAQDIAEVG